MIVKNHRQIGAGFNGSVHGDEHCPPDGSCAIDGHCGRSIHAEVNAVLQAMSLAPQQVAGSVAFVTHYPCWHCLATMAQAGVRLVVYDSAYGPTDARVYRLLKNNPKRIKTVRHGATAFQHTWEEYEAEASSSR